MAELLGNLLPSGHILPLLVVAGGAWYAGYRKGYGQGKRYEREQARQVRRIIRENGDGEHGR